MARKSKKPSQKPAAAGALRAKSLKTGVDRVIEKLKQQHCRFPIRHDELLDKCEGRVGDSTVRELARRGMLVESELWDGSLTSLQANVLAGHDVSSRADFRLRYLAGELDMGQWRRFGNYKREQILVWAGLPRPKNAWRHVQFKLDLQTCEKLETLLQQRGLHSRDELIAQLVAAA